jgi:hypothetical protein
MEHIGKYKGYEVYKVPKHEMEYNSGKTLYAVAETGELVLKGEVVGKVNFNSGSVTEFDDHKCYAYKYPRKEEPKPKRGKRAEVVTPDMVLTSQVVDPTDLDKLINEFIIAARSMTIEDYVKAEV